MKKKVAINIGLLLVFLVGLALIFNNQIKEFVVEHLEQSSLKQEIAKPKKKASYNLENVAALDAQTALKAALKGVDAPIGKIAIPSVGMKLAIYEGVANINLAHGAGTMKPNQQMGQGNYALAGHHMANENILFSPLAKAKVGQIAYLTDGKKIYKYKLTKRVVVNEDQIQWIDDVPAKKLLTLVTCSSSQPGVKMRLIFQGELVSAEKLTKKTSQYFV
ncbi:class A sortase [Ligilactobacillus sp. Marseille-Q7487]|uniref:class A sortase n=1 Tax=Ligilactobacillus sp. Marseille-Q7487 TaxID=3022128 RepID=UPI0024A96278|nr:class A sortase [Ligilactobacillus sp. Marseille-Q7487]